MNLWAFIRPNLLLFAMKSPQNERDCGQKSALCTRRAYPELTLTNCCFAENFRASEENRKIESSEGAQTGSTKQPTASGLAMWSLGVGFSLGGDGEPLEHLRQVSGLHDQMTGCLEGASAVSVPMLPDNVRQILKLIGLSLPYFKVRQRQPQAPSGICRSTQNATVGSQPSPVFRQRTS